MNTATIAISCVANDHKIFQCTINAVNINPTTIFRCTTSNRKTIQYSCGIFPGIDSDYTSVSTAINDGLINKRLCTAVDDRIGSYNNILA